MAQPHEQDARSQERYSVLRVMLEDRRREIQEKLHSLLETLPDQTAAVRDIEEQSVNDFVQEVDFALMQMKSDTLSKIDEALQRLDQGVYGVCSDCSREIGAPRLRALPFADRCRDCQEAQEAQDQQETRQAMPALGSRLREALALTPDREAKND